MLDLCLKIQTMQHMWSVFGIGDGVHFICEAHFNLVKTGIAVDPLYKSTNQNIERYNTLQHCRVMLSLPYAVTPFPRLWRLSWPTAADHWLIPEARQLHKLTCAAPWSPPLRLTPSLLHRAHPFTSMHRGHVVKRHTCFNKSPQRSVSP